MDGRYGVAIPTDIAAKIKERLDKVRGELQKKIILTEKKVATGNPKAIAERKDLIFKLNRLTESNMLRLATIAGAKVLHATPDEDVIKNIMESGLVRGRRRHAA